MLDPQPRPVYDDMLLRNTMSEALDYLERYDDRRFWRVSREQVARAIVRANQVARFRAGIDACAARAVAEFGTERSLCTFAAVVWLEQQTCLPVPLWPSQTWGGGPAELNNWYY